MDSAEQRRTSRLREQRNEAERAGQQLDRQQAVIIARTTVAVARSYELLERTRHLPGMPAPPQPSEPADQEPADQANPSDQS